MGMREIAIGFIKNLSVYDKEKIKEMINHGVVCGLGFAKKNNVEPSALNEELKSIFKEK